MIKRTARLISRLLWAVIITALVSVALYVSLGRYYISYVEQYQQQLIARFVQTSGLPVTVDRLYGRWSKLSPILIVEGLKLSTPNNQEPVLAVDSISLQLDPFKSLLNQVIQVQNLHINDFSASLQEASPGKWQLEGYAIDSDPSATFNFDKLHEIILSAESAELYRARLSMRNVKGEDSLVDLRELSLQRANDFRRLRLEVYFDDSKKPLLALLESIGDPRDWDDFSAKGYLKLDDVDFKSQLPALRSFGVDLQEAQVDSEIWLDLQTGGEFSVQGHVFVPLLDIAALSGEPLAPLKNVRFKFRAEKSKSEVWQAWLPELSANWQEQSFQLSQMTMITTNRRLRFSLPELNLDKTLNQLMATDLLTGKSRETIEALAVSGSLENIHFSLSRGDNTSQISTSLLSNNAPLFGLRANLNKVGIQPWHGAPGASGVSGYLDVTPTVGRVELASENMSMEFPVVYKKPLNFLSARGQVEWRIEKDRVLVDSSYLNILTDHGPVVGLLDLDLGINANAKRPPTMDLTIGLKDVDVNYRDRYIPYILNEKFLDWMASSVPKGRVVDGAFLYRGSLRKNDEKNRTVQLYFNIDQTELAYQQGWPPLTDISGLVLINNTEVDVTTSAAKLFQLDLTDTSVSVRPHDNGGMWLTVDTNAIGDAKSGLRVVNESVISGLVGDVFKRWELNGNVAATVKLGIPIGSDTLKPDINVAVQLSEADLHIPAYRVFFDDINGPINYSTKNGIGSSGIAATLYKKPVEINVKEGAEKAINVSIEGRVDISDVQNWSRQPALSFVDGETDFLAKINIHPKNNDSAANSVFTVNSNLVGINIDLPAPYNKIADKAEHFWLQMPIGKDVNLLTMGLQELELQLLMNQNGVESGLLIIGEEEHLQHEPSRLTVVGEIDQFEYELWQAVLERYQRADKNITQTGSGQQSKQGMSIKVRDFNIVTFKGFGQQYSHSIININREPTSWHLSASNSVLAGSLVIDDDEKKPLQVNLERLALKTSETANDAIGAEINSFKQLNIDLDIQKLFVNDQHYGQLSLDIRGYQQGLNIENISGHIRGASIDPLNPASLEWFDKGEGQHSRFYGQLSIGDIGDVLEQWNYERFIESKQGKADIDLSWQGSPNQWQLQKSLGSLSINLKEGRFLKASDTASSTLKVVGIVNLTNIVRRLQLNFTDLYKSGVSFDEIVGQAELGEGYLTILDDLIIKSPSSDFVLRGNADLINENLDMSLIVTLPVANNLPWIAALAGGLPTAAGVYVASKIFEKQVDRFSSAVYGIQGNWNDPEIKFNRVFDRAKKIKDPVNTDTKSSTRSNSTNAKANKFKTNKNVEKTDNKMDEVVQ